MSSALYRGSLRCIPSKDPRSVSPQPKHEPGRVPEFAQPMRTTMPAEKVMIVDDERLVRWSLRQKCEEWGYTVIEADCGDTALKLAQRESPDLVLLGVRLA